jgi:periodic tryptophan protein 2|mmetsp:Transcript_29507/g.5336  ORF Transcript_29507/g.5336 Transcript_29507/m.5336 type:complete len:86 (+) Transcript_29507:1010-1267(+)
MGHSSDILCSAYSPDNSIIATGSVDGKIKLWANGICFITFEEHSNSIVDLVITNTNAVISASTDGTVRAFDINKYRMFRTMTTPT